ncbi:hypothetical protein [Enterovirga sp. CN4-39]|uniref:hypothetical protein n=1 Tax=Enterovirga sp. CN4-39 TaxID=3400910 RepID=UPI003BFD05AB
METQTTPQEKDHPLGDETFMSADDLRAYTTELRLAKASKDVDSMSRADKARDELVKTLSARMELTPEKLQEITGNLLRKLRTAAEKGDTELMVMRFPNALCSDKGRAINNGEPDWPETLTGRPRQAYELWLDRLRPAGYGLAAMIVEWPRGMPGDIGFFLTWGDKRTH